VVYPLTSGEGLLGEGADPWTRCANTAMSPDGATPGACLGVEESPICRGVQAQYAHHRKAPLKAGFFFAPERQSLGVLAAETAILAAAGLDGPGGELNA
jgi:hypothetical protein